MRNLSLSGGPYPTHYTRAVSFRGALIAVAVCVAVAAETGGANAAGQGGPQPLRLHGRVKHCRNLRFSERLRAHGTGCSEARLVAQRAVRHIDSDSESGWRVEAQVRGRHRVWNCAGAGFNPLPLACRRPGRWIKFQVWAD